MCNDTEDISKLTECTCLIDNEELEIEDLNDANFWNLDCPVHGIRVRLSSEE